MVHRPAWHHGAGGRRPAFPDCRRSDSSPTGVGHHAPSVRCVASFAVAAPEQAYGAAAAQRGPEQVEVQGPRIVHESPEGPMRRGPGGTDRVPDSWSRGRSLTYTHAQVGLFRGRGSEGSSDCPWLSQFLHRHPALRFAHISHCSFNQHGAGLSDPLRSVCSGGDFDPWLKEAVSDFFRPRCSTVSVRTGRTVLSNHLGTDRRDLRSPPPTPVVLSLLLQVLVGPLRSASRDRGLPVGHGTADPRARLATRRGSGVGATGWSPG